MFMKTRRLIIDRQLKRKISANKKLFMIKSKKQKTEHSSNNKINIQNVDGVKDETLIAGSCKKTISRKRPFIKTDKKSTRKLSSNLTKAIKGRKKRKMEKVDKVNEPMDRISELPEAIIHHILTLLRCPRDVARTTAWSRKWRTIFTSFYFFDFDQKRFKSSGCGDHTEKFITYVENSLRTKLEPMHSVQKFKISLSQANPKLKLHMNYWIYSAINKDVKELEIHVEEKKRRHYSLPEFVLSSKTLTSLKLYGCKFDTESVINLVNLKELSIKNAHVNGDIILNCIQGCPLIEDLRLIHCKGIGHLHISNLRYLKKIELHECHGLVAVSVELTSLISFSHWSKQQWFCDMNLSGCVNLKYLTLKDWTLTEELFLDYFMKFPDLEKLCLRECDELERICILSKKLKELSVIKCRKVKDVIIHAPNLSSLEYFGEWMPFSSINVAGLHEVKINLKIKKSKIVLRDLLAFLRKFENNGAWKLIVNSNKNITIHEELRKVMHLSSNDLKLELIKSPMKLKGYIGNLLRMSRPKTLSVVSFSNSEFLKFLNEKIISREKNPKCCTYYMKKCWLHYIKDVKMVVFEKGGNGDTCQDLQQTTFKFNWQS